MAQFRPTLPFSTALIVLKPTSIEKVMGVPKKVFPDLKDGIRINASFKTYGGTRSEEKTVDGLMSIEDTAYVQTWYRPDITSDCRIVVAQTGATYEIINDPENINCRNQFLKFMVRRVKGGV